MKEVILVIPTKHAWLIHPYQFQITSPEVYDKSTPTPNAALHSESCLCPNTSARLHGVACLNQGLKLGAPHATAYLVFDTCANQSADSHQGEQRAQGPPIQSSSPMPQKTRKGIFPPLNQNLCLLTISEVAFVQLHVSLQYPHKNYN